MKKKIIPILLILCLIGSGLQLLAQKSLKVNSSIDEVTVYRNGAYINRSGSLTISAGENIVTFRRITRNLLEQSISVDGKGNFQILDVQHQVNYLKEYENQERYDSLFNESNKLRKEINLKEGQKGILAKEEALLDANRKFGGNEGINTTQLETVLTYYRKQLERIKKEELKLEEEISELKIIQQKINQQLNAMGSPLNLATSDVIVKLYSERGGKIDLNLSYFTYSAQWYPTYDARVKDINSPLSLFYRANISQQTGEDWENVQLFLSNAMPSMNGTAPTMNPWYLRPPREIYRNYNDGQAEPMRAAPAMEEVVISKKAARSDVQVSVERSTTSFAFKVPEPVSIIHGEPKKTIHMLTHELPAIYEYFTAPKIDKNVFLLAKVHDWSKLDLLPGQINIYFEGRYVGNSSLNPNISADTLRLSLGSDLGIITERKVREDYSKDRILGSDKTETKGYEITLRNTKSYEIEVQVVDQIPLSTSSEIEVMDLELGSGKLNKETGKLTWKLKVPANSSKSVSFGFKVKYPKDMNLGLY